MKLKAVIFDLDGVIADSEPLSARVDDVVLEKYGIKMTPEEKHNAFGRRKSEILGDVFESRNKQVDMEELITQCRRVLLEMMAEELKPIKNSIELVKFLKDSGFEVAVATSSSSYKLENSLKKLGIEDMFEIKVSCDDVKRGKPDPEIFLKTAEKLKLEPEQCAVIEDSRFGVQSAKAAGMFTIGFRSPNSSGQDLSAADKVVDDLEEVKSSLTRD